MDSVHTVVVGAGVIGLAAAHELAQAGREVLVLEAEARFGSVTSARNSEVIHAGIYYPAGSWRARLCLRGKHLLYAFCERHHVGHRRCGKLIVATDAGEGAALQALRARAEACGVHDLRTLDARQVRSLEPALRCHGALLSPSTGIVDSHALMLALLGEAERAGATLALRAPVVRGRVVADGFELDVGGAGATTLRARELVNAAGLGAPALAAAMAGLDARHVPQQYLAKGAYFTLAGRAPFSHLVYPAPGDAGHLGVHLTLDLGGQARFGPSFQWVDHIDYAVDAGDATGFYDAVRRYWPALPDGALQPGYAGVRPKLSGPGEAAADFRIDGPDVHGIAGLVNLFGIESPGLTSSLAIAEEVLARLDG